MPKAGALPASDLVTALIIGGEVAYQRFYAMSGGYWLGHAPEYFLTTQAASALHGQGKVLVNLEASVSETRVDAEAVSRGRPRSKDRRHGRYDIVLYWSNGTPRAAVEVKSPLWSADIRRIEPDLERLCSTLKCGPESSFQFCVFLYYASVAEPIRIHDSAHRRLEAMIERINAHASTIAESHGLASRPMNGHIHQGDEPGAWVVATCLFTRPGGGRAFT